MSLQGTARGRAEEVLLVGPASLVINQLPITDRGTQLYTGVGLRYASGDTL